MRPALRPLQTLHRQCGMATMLVVLLVGLAMTATAMTVFFRVRGTQDMQMSVHASTQAEIKAWEGVQALTQVLNNSSLAPAVYAQVQGGTCPSVSIGLSGVSVAITSCSSSTMQLTAAVTGTSGPATSTVQVIYQLAQSGSSGSGTSTTSPAVTINGDLTYSGGGMSFMNGSVLANVAVNGNITVTNGSSANLAGCATGNISLSGGGIASGSTLSALGDLTISSMTAPTNVTLWAKDISMSGTGGTYTALKAGAFAVDVLSDGSKVGTAYVGGTASGTSVTPNSSSISVTLSAGGSATYSYPTNSGHTITLVSNANSPYGGVITTASMSFTATDIWGDTISIGSGGTRTITTLKGNSKISTIDTPTLSNVIGGGNYYLLNSNKPSIGSGTVVGNAYSSSGATTTIPNLTTGAAASTAPGLPGLPTCNVKTNSYNVSDYKSSANYVFYLNGSNGHPMVIIQNVKTKAGVDISGTYDLLSNTLQTSNGYALFQCGWYNSACFTTSTANSSGWSLTGIYNWPPGIYYFDGNLSINGVSGNASSGLLSTFLVNGTLTLGSSSSTIYAPNFSTATAVCGGNFWPGNVCSSSSALGTTSLANDAVVVQTSLATSGWTFYGNVITGTSVTTSGSTNTIYGGLYEGQNTASAITISSGGISVNTSSVTSSQAATGIGSTSTATTSTTYTATPLWTKYL